MAMRALANAVPCARNHAVLASRIYDYREHVPKLRHAKLKQMHFDFDVRAHELVVRDNVRMSFWDKDLGLGDDHM